MAIVRLIGQNILVAVQSSILAGSGNVFSDVRSRALPYRNREAQSLLCLPRGELRLYIQAGPGTLF